MVERTAAEDVDALVDPGTFAALAPPTNVVDDALRSTDPAYGEQLAAARAATGADDAVVAGTAAVGGHPVVVVVSEFGFLAGTLSAAAGEAFAAALDEASARRLPLVAVARSGGARMQEGTLGFVQMVKAVGAVRRLRQAGLPFVVHLAHPTTGGVLASWASLGHVTFAEPGATVAFTGPRVAEALTGDDGGTARVAEGLLAAGHVDGLVPTGALRSRVVAVLDVVDGAPSRAAAPPAVAPGGEPRGWRAVVASRRHGRRTTADVLASSASDVTVLRGDRAGGGDDRSCIAQLCRFGGRPVVVVAGTGDGPATAAGLRKARRALCLAGEVGLPVVTLVDVAGADLGGGQEVAGLAGEVARVTDELLHLPCPTVAVLCGQGGGGAALALLAADRVVAVPESWLAPIGPEAASVILWGTTAGAEAVADAQQVGAVEQVGKGLVDRVVPADGLAAAVGAELDHLATVPAADRLRRRADRFRSLGRSSCDLGAPLAQAPVDPLP